MDSREQQIYDEAAALWREVFNEPAPALTDGPTMLKIIMRCAGPPPYERLHSPHLRPSTIAGPAQPRDEAQLG